MTILHSASTLEALLQAPIPSRESVQVWRAVLTIQSVPETVYTVIRGTTGTMLAQRVREGEVFQIQVLRDYDNMRVWFGLDAAQGRTLQFYRDAAEEQYIAENERRAHSQLSAPMGPLPFPAPRSGSIN